MTRSNPPLLTEALLAGLHQGDSLARVSAATLVARAGDLRALGPLLEAVDRPLRRNHPAHDAYLAAYAALVQLIDAAGASIAPEVLRRLSDLADPSYDVMYYLEGDAHYDAGHDVVDEDFSAIRAAAARALDRQKP